MSMEEPLVVVIAGPNGAGKSTSAPLLLRDTLEVQEFVNADAIAKGLSAFHPESVAIQAGRLMLRRMKELVRTRTDFAFETTLASRTFAPWLRRLADDGHHVHLAFLTLPTPDLAVARVKGRVRLGGHHVPEDVVRRRFEAGLRNFFHLYWPIVSSWQLFDNMSPTGPRLLASQKFSAPIRILDEPMWQEFEQRYGK